MFKPKVEGWCAKIERYLKENPGVSVTCRMLCQLFSCPNDIMHSTLQYLERMHVVEGVYKADGKHYVYTPQWDIRLRRIEERAPGTYKERIKKVKSQVEPKKVIHREPFMDPSEPIEIPQMDLSRIESKLDHLIKLWS